MKVRRNSMKGEEAGWIGEETLLDSNDNSRREREKIKVSECTFKAIIYRDLEDVYGPCGCGMDMAMWPVLLPRAWMVEEKPVQADEDGFGIGFDYRRVAGFSCNRVFEHEMEGIEYLANYSCCKECAEKAVKSGYAVWSEKEYPMVLR